MIHHSRAFLVPVARLDGATVVVDMHMTVYANLRRDRLNGICDLLLSVLVLEHRLPSIAGTLASVGEIQVRSEACIDLRIRMAHFHVSGVQCRTRAASSLVSFELPNHS
jgi:hypothetical protein